MADNPVNQSLVALLDTRCAPTIVSTRINWLLEISAYPVNVGTGRHNLLPNDLRCPTLSGQFPGRQGCYSLCRS